MPPLDYDTLTAELRDDPLARGYAAMTHDQAAASLNAAALTVPYSRRVTIRDMLAELGATATATILQAIDNADDPLGLLALALGMLGEYGVGGGLDLGHANARAVIDSLVAGKVLTADQGEEIKALAEHEISRADQLGLGELDAAHIISARAILGQ